MFKDMMLKTRLIIQGMLLTVIMIIIGILGIRGIDIAIEGAKTIYDGGIDSIEFLEKLQNFVSVDLEATTEKIRDEIISWEEGAHILNQGLGKIPTYLEQYSKTDLNDEQKAKFEHIKTLLKNNVSTIEKLIDVINKKNKEQFINFIKSDVYLAIAMTVDEITNLINSHVQSTKQDYEESLAASRYFEKLMIVMIVIAIIIALFFSIFTIRSITLPLAKTKDILNRVSLGDNSVQIEIESHNEIGDMMTSLKTMIESIKMMSLPLIKVSQGDLTGNVTERSENDVLARAINEMITKLREMISETQEEILVIANSAEEVSSSVSEVSAGTTETAAAVTETTTTVEELQQTAQVSSSKAEDVLKSSEETLRVVKTSEQSLKNTIDDMTHIQEKMNVISESIVKLSEHSLVIGDIITTVNELAEQSNLLAVNAAIEAAKAGEQGKGFGVVAQEIRTLAEQSKGATSQVRSILNDIQNATSTAVMATEQGSKAVNKGVKQSHETNAAMQSVVSNITQVSQAAKQISISSQQQLIGVEQVRTAMANINLASEQHVEHMRQIETAVLSLNEVSKNFKEMISHYKLSDERDFGGNAKREMEIPRRLFKK